MPRLRDALMVVTAGAALSLLGAGTAAATPNGNCPPPPDQQCQEMPTDGCHGGMGAGINLGGLLDGLLGGLFGGEGACCADPD
jgi:hypothetical protein